VTARFSDRGDEELARDVVAPREGAREVDEDGPVRRSFAMRPDAPKIESTIVKRPDVQELAEHPAVGCRTRPTSGKRVTTYARPT